MMRKRTEGRANIEERTVAQEAGGASAEGKEDDKRLRAAEMVINIKYKSALLIKMQGELLSPLFSYCL